MEQGLINYIKNMFAMEDNPEWAPAYEGVIFYNKVAKKWVMGTDAGWKSVDRKEVQTKALDINKWIDAFEYLDSDKLKGLYKLSTSSGISISTDTNSSYGDYSMKVTTSGGALNEYVYREFDPPVELQGDSIQLDISANNIGTRSTVVFSQNYEGSFPTPAPDTTYTAKTVILDFANNWGYGYMGIRSVEFFYNDVLIPMPTSEFSSYASSIYNSNYDEKYAFDTTRIKNENQLTRGWLSGNGLSTNQRISITFNTTQTFNKVVINNAHEGGGFLTEGVKDTKIYVSPDAVSDNTYGSNLESTTLIFDGTIPQHAAIDGADDYTLDLVEVTPPYTSVVVIDKDEVPTNQSNFSMYIDLSDMDDTFWSIVTENGGDIRCYLLDNTQIPREVVYIDKQTKVGEIHVKLPIVLSKEDTVLKVVVDNASVEPAVDSTYGRNAVWTDHDAVLNMVSETYPTVIEDTFTGPDGAEKDSILWGAFQDSATPPTGSINIQNNKLNVNLTFTGTTEWQHRLWYSNFSISGDFNVEVDFDSFDSGNVENTGMHFQIFSKDLSSYIYIGVFREASSDAFVSRITGMASETSVSRTNNYGKLKIVRTGSTATTYYVDGDGAETLMITDTCTTDDVIIRFRNSTYNPTTLTGNWDNFKINSGDAGWDLPIKDSTGNGYTGTPQGSLNSSDIVIGGALRFDGINDAISLGDVFNIGTSDFFVGGWFKFNWSDANEYNALVSKWQVSGQPRMDIDSYNGTVRFQIEYNATTNKVSVTYPNTGLFDGEYHYIVGMVDRDADMSLFIDGDIVASTSASPIAGNDVSNNQPFGIGAYANAGSGVLDAGFGQIDCADLKISYTLPDIETLRLEYINKSKPTDFYSVLNYIPKKKIVSKDIYINELNTFQTETFDTSPLNKTSYLDEVRFIVTDDSQDTAYHIDKMKFFDLNPWYIDKFIYTSTSGLNEYYTSIDESKAILTTSSGYSTYGGYSAHLTASGGGVNGGLSTTGSYVSVNKKSELASFDIMSDRIGTNIECEFSQKQLVAKDPNPTFTTKSIVLDITDNWGDGSYIQLRSIEFFMDDTRIDLIGADFTSYGTFYSDASLHPENILDTSTSKFGSASNNGWVSASQSSNVRLSWVFNTPIQFNKIVINNGHESGGSTTRGVGNIKLYRSNFAIDSTTFDEKIMGGVQIFEGLIPQHPATNTVEDVVIALKEEEIYAIDQCHESFTIGTENPTYIGGAFDGVLGSDATGAWYAYDGGYVTTGWTGQDFGEGNEQAITRVRMISSLSDRTYDPKNFTIEASDTGTWSGEQTILHTVTDHAFIQNEWVEFLFENDISYRYYRINVSQNAGGAYLIISEIKMFPNNLPVHTAKSVIFDFADNWGHPSQFYMVVRSLDFYYKGELINISDANADAYATSTFVGYAPISAFDTSASKIGGWAGTNSWVSANGNITNQRLIVVFNTSQTFDSIVINNGHNAGGDTAVGVKNTKIYIADDEYVDVGFDAGTSTDTLEHIFSGTLDPHVTSSTIDNQLIPIEGMSIKYAKVNKDINIIKPYVFQKEYVSLGALSLHNNIDEIKFTINNADVSTNYYIDNLRFEENPAYNWIDSVEYSTQNDLNNAYTVSSGVLTKEPVSDVTSYGKYALQLTALSGSLGEYLHKELDTYLEFTENRICYDIMSDREGNNLKAIFDFEPNNLFENPMDEYDERNKIEIIIDKNKVDGDHTDFPIYIDLATLSGTSFFNTVRDDGGDIRCTLDADAEILLPREVVYIDKTNNTGEIHVKLPNVYTSQDTRFYLWVNGTSTEPDASSAYGRNTVWSDYLAVYHMAAPTTASEQLTYTAKSVIFDFADGWGDSEYVSIRSIEFHDTDGLINVVSGYSAYSTTVHASFPAGNAFNTSYSKTGPHDPSWFSLSGFNTSQRLIVVFDSPITFKDIIINNSHHSGGYTVRGVKTTKIYTSLDAITSTVYNESISRSMLIFDGQIPAHAQIDQIDDFTVPIEEPLQVIDSTGNGNDGTPKGSMTSTNVVEGSVGKALKFDGINDYVEVGTGVGDFTGGKTYQCWFNTNTYGDTGFGRLFHKGDDGVNEVSSQLYFRAEDSQLNYYRSFSSDTLGSWRTPIGSIQPNTDYLFHMVYNSDGSANVPTFFLNGSVPGTMLTISNPSGSPLNIATKPAYIGSRGSDKVHEGVMDEVRFCKSELSANHITTEYNNQNSPETFYSVSSLMAETYKMKDRLVITIDHDKVPEFMTDVPVYIDLSHMQGTSFFGKVKLDGGDIRCTFYPDGNWLLPREVVWIDTENQKGELHVKLPKLYKDKDTVFYIWVDGTNKEPQYDSTYGRNAVWSDYYAVYHMNYSENTSSRTDVDDSFTGFDGEIANEVLWRDNGLEGLRIKNNQLRVIDSPPSGTSQYISKFVMTGDFDIQVDFQIYNDPSPAAGGAYRGPYLGLRGIFDIMSSVKLFRWNGQNTAANKKGLEIYIDGVVTLGWSTEDQTSYATSGTLRLVRVGDKITAHCDGYTWSNKTFISGPVTLDLSISNYDLNNVMDAALDNFKVNSGQVTWLPGIIDSTGKGNTGLLDGNLNEGSFVESDMGKAVLFDRSNLDNGINCGFRTNFDNLAIEAMFKKTVTSGTQYQLVSKNSYYATAHADFPNALLAGTDIWAGYSSGDDYNYDVSLHDLDPLVPNKYYNAVSICTPDNGTHLYVDGKLKVSGASVAMSDNSRNWYIGRASYRNADGANDTQFMGEIADIRFSENIKNDSWYKVQYENQNNTENFYKVTSLSVEKNISINATGYFQKETVDISHIQADAKLKSVRFEIINDDIETTYTIDNIRFE